MEGEFYLLLKFSSSKKKDSRPRESPENEIEKKSSLSSSPPPPPLLPPLTHRERRVQPQPVGRHPPRAPLLPVDEHDDVGDVEALGLERLDGLHHARAAGHQVLDDQALLPSGEGALDGFFGAVVLDLLAAHQHGDLVAQRHARRDRKGGVRHAAEVVEFRFAFGGHSGPHRVGDLSLLFL